MKTAKDKEPSVQKYVLKKLEKSMDKNKYINPKDRVFYNFRKL